VAQTWLLRLRRLNPQRIEPQSYTPTLRYAVLLFCMNNLDRGKKQDCEGDPNEQWSIAASQKSLKEDPNLATLMLRLGAAANAIHAAQRWTLSCKDASGPASQRDLIWSFLVATAYLKEAIDSLLRPYYREIVELVRKDGASEDGIRSLGDLMSKKQQGLYKRVLVNARNRLVFHWEEEPFRRWAEHHNEPIVTWAQGTGDKEGEVVYVAAGIALLDSLMPGASDAEIRRRIGDVAEASGLLVGIFERAISGYLLNYVG
jgi:hypothetical protein